MEKYTNDPIKHDALEIPEWEEDKIIKEKQNKFEKDLTETLDDLKLMLIEKNRKYGDAAINPIRVFSKASNVEQIKVRLDDKISRLKTQQIDEDEDVLKDLLGYLVLLQICLNRNKE